MSNMSVTGLLPTDEKWNKMYAVYKVCNEAKIQAPLEVLDFFEHVYFPYIDTIGIEVPIDGCVSEHGRDLDNGRDALVVDLSKLPAGVVKLIFETRY